MPAPLPHPGVRFPPPFLFVLGFLVGLLLDRVFPLVLLPGGPVPLRAGIGWALVALGLGLVVWAGATFRAAQTAIFPNRPASAIVEAGPYKYSRNPMYVGMGLLYVGLALWQNMLWPLVVLPLVYAALWALVVRREERYLAGAFGDAYAGYRRRVRRWL